MRKEYKSIITQIFEFDYDEKEFKNYYVHRKRKLIYWKDIYQSNDCNKSIVLCIIKSNMFSQDHIIAISGGWIFDGHLNYTIPLSEESLN